MATSEGGGRARLDALLPLLCLSIVASGASACGLRDGSARPNFVLVVVDSLRADRLRFAGYERGRSPRFDQLQRESIWFSRGYSTSSWTLPSTASLFLSQLASRHGVSNWSSKLTAEQMTLVDRLRAGGYRTGMWTANRIVAGGRGFGERFDHYELVRARDPRGGPDTDATAFGSADDLVSRALAWMAEFGGGEAPFFAYLHFMEPHTPYHCPDSAPARCAQEARRTGRRLLDFDWDFTEIERDRLRGWYDAEVSRMDAALADLLDGMDEQQRMQDTWVILVADHGELLGKWDMYMHGRTLYEELVRIPMLFRSPSGRAAQVEQPVSLIDVAPTILDIAGLPVPDDFAGRSLEPLLEGEALAPRPVVAELLQVKSEPDPLRRHVLAVVDGETKYRLTENGQVERIDLAADPNELNPLPARIEDLERAMSAAGQTFDAARYGPTRVSGPDAEMEEALRELGYVR